MEVSPEPPLEPSRILAGRYRLDRLVASGGFGTVYAGRHLVLDAPIAIKVLRRDRFNSEEGAAQVATFLSEARTLARLRHPNIVSVLDAGVVAESSLPWMVLEWCDGRTLKDLLADRRGARRTPRAAWKILRPIAEAVAHAHANGIVHRDLKPSNILLANDHGALVPRVVDFGIAKELGGDASSTGDTATRDRAIFTPAYAAPEQVTGSRTGPWTDVHGLALLFVELLRGGPPYGAGNPLEAAVAPNRPTPRALGLDVDDAFEEVLARALASKPSTRQPNAASFVADVDAALPGDDASDVVNDTGPSIAVSIPIDTTIVANPSAEQPMTTTVPTESGPVRPRKPVKPAPRRWTVVAGAIALTAAALAAGVWIDRHHDAVASPIASAALEAGGSTWHVQAGSWHVEGGALYGSGGQIISDSDLGDGTLELDFELVAGHGKRALGIGFRAAPTDDADRGSGYGANFSTTESTFNVYKGKEGEWSAIDPSSSGYRESPAIHPGKNHVAIHAAGKSFVLEVNGERIASFEDDAYATGRVTLWVESPSQTVRFSNIRGLGR